MLLIKLKMYCIKDGNAMPCMSIFFFLALIPVRQLYSSPQLVYTPNIIWVEKLELTDGISDSHSDSS